MTVNKLENADIGSTVWLYDMDANVYESGVYKGRGAYKERTVEGKTNKSFTVDGYKFDKVTGAQMGLRGYSPRLFIMGDEEKENRRFVGRHRFHISRLVESCQDANKLKAIAEILYYNLGEDE